MFLFFFLFHCSVVRLWVTEREERWNAIHLFSLTLLMSCLPSMVSLFQLSLRTWDVREVPPPSFICFLYRMRFLAPCFVLQNECVIRPHGWNCRWKKKKFLIPQSYSECQSVWVCRFLCRDEKFDFNCLINLWMTGCDLCWMGMQVVTKKETHLLNIFFRRTKAWIWQQKYN